MIEIIFRESFLHGSSKNLSRKMLNSKMGPGEDHGLVNVIKAIDWVEPRHNTELVVEKRRLDNFSRFSMSKREINKGFPNSVIEKRRKATSYRFVYKIQHSKKKEKAN